MYTKIRIEEIVFGFNESANSIFNLILYYKQKLQGTPKERSFIILVLTNQFKKKS